MKEKWCWGMRRVCKTRMTLTSRHTAAWLETRSLASSGVSDCTAPTPSCPVGPPVKYRPRARWPPSSAPPLPHQSSPGTASRHLDAVRWTTNNHVNKERDDCDTGGSSQHTSSEEALHWWPWRPTFSTLMILPTLMSSLEGASSSLSPPALAPFPAASDHTHKKRKNTHTQMMTSHIRLLTSDVMPN